MSIEHNEHYIKMKAIQYNSFGDSNVIELVEVPTPELTNNHDVLIKVKAASVNPLDMKIRMGYMQKMRPVQLPFYPGLDASGIVEAVGSEVTKFKVGDEVIAVTMEKAYAEYVLANEHFVFFKPSTISFEEATSLGVNIGTAETILFKEGHLQEGQKVLIHGAAGAAGATMVQMAKHRGIYVIATATGAGIDLVKELGADEVYDYKTNEVFEKVKHVDLVADCAGGESQNQLFGLILSGGKLLSIAGMPSVDLAKEHNIDARFISSDLSAKNSENGLSMVKEGTLKPIVKRTFPLEEAAKAQDFLSAGGVHGKVVLVME